MPTTNPSVDSSLPMATSEQEPRVGSCCSGWRIAQWGIAVIGVVGLCTLAFVLGRHWHEGSASSDSRSPLPLIDATAAASSEGYSIATGPVSERSEGLFLLDHNSGLLQCQVLYPRVGQFMASFQINITEALGTAGKGGNYLMLTGAASFPGPGNQSLAPSVVYVLDTATGSYACFGVPFDRVAQNARRPQSGTMVVLAKGAANLIPDRDRLR